MQCSKETKILNCVCIGLVILAGATRVVGYTRIGEHTRILAHNGVLCMLFTTAALIWLFQLQSVVRETAEATPGLILALLGTGCVTFLLTDVLLRRFAVLWRRKLRGRWMRG